MRTGTDIIAQNRIKNTENGNRIFFLKSATIPQFYTVVELDVSCVPVRKLYVWGMVGSLKRFEFSGFLCTESTVHTEQI